MAEHDDELARRIHAVLGMAQQDAPEPAADRAAVRVTTPWPTTRRWPVHAGALAAAAAVLAVVLVATRGDDRDTTAVVTEPTTAPAPQTTTPGSGTGAAPSTTMAPTTTVLDLSTCGRSLAYPYEDFGQVHTVVESELPIEVSFDAPPYACVGGSAAIVVTARNTSDADVQFERTELLVTAGGADKWVVGSIGPALIPAATDVDLPTTIAVPSIAPGSYSLFAYGLSRFTDLTIVGPTVCGGGQLATSVVQQDGASMRQYTVTRVTNQDDVPCVLPRLSSVQGVTADGTVEYLQLQPGQGYFDPLSDPLRDYVLQPGEQADVYITTSSACLDGTVQPKVYPRVQAQLGLNLQGDTGVLIDLDTNVDVACGLWVSDWSEPAAR